MTPLLQLLLQAGTFPGETAIRAILEWDIRNRDQMDDEVRKRLDAVRAQIAEDWVKIYRMAYKAVGVDLG